MKIFSIKWWGRPADDNDKVWGFIKFIGMLVIVAVFIWGFSNYSHIQYQEHTITKTIASTGDYYIQGISKAMKLWFNDGSALIVIGDYSLLIGKTYEIQYKESELNRPQITSIKLLENIDDN